MNKNRRHSSLLLVTILIVILAGGLLIWKFQFSRPAVPLPSEPTNSSGSRMHSTLLGIMPERSNYRMVGELPITIRLTSSGTSSDQVIRGVDLRLGGLSPDKIKQIETRMKVDGTNQSSVELNPDGTFSILLAGMNLTTDQTNFVDLIITPKNLTTPLAITASGELAVTRNGKTGLQPLGEIAPFFTIAP